MPVSVTNSKLIYDALKACDVKIMSALPETWLVHLIHMADDDPDMTLVRIAKEEEAVGISAGAHLAGVNSALLMQNHGFLAAINPIVCWHCYTKFLCLCSSVTVVTWARKTRGRRKAALLTNLSASLEHSYLAPEYSRRYLPPSQGCTNAGYCFAASRRRLTVTRTNVGGINMLRSDALQAIYPDLQENIVVTIMGAVAAELYMFGHRHSFFYLEHAWAWPRQWDSVSHLLPNTK